jgi:hypothetical protein
MKLPIAVGMLLAFLSFAVALQTVAHLHQQRVPCHGTDAIPLCSQSIGQLIHALACPA